MAGIFEPEHIAGKLEQRMLEPTACAQERNLTLSGLTNDPERPVSIAIGTGRDTPRTCKIRKHRVVAGDCGIRCKPNRLDRQGLALASQIEAAHDRLVR